MNLDRSDFMKLSTEILSRDSCVRFRALGGSMYPFIRNNDVVVIKPVDGSKVRLGDVLFCRTSQGGLVAHRLIKKYGRNGNAELVTKGDSLPNVDNPVFLEDVLGKVVAIESEKRRTNLDNAQWRLLNLLLAKVSPFSPWIYPVVRRTKRIVRRVLCKVQ